MNGGPKPFQSCTICSCFIKEGKEGSIEYESRNDGKETYAIVVCQDCLKKPDRIDVRKITETLNKSEYWDKKEIGLVKKALNKFKEGKMKRKKKVDGTITYYVPE